MANRERNQSRMTVEEYLRFEEQSDVRHEYVAGEIYAMSDGIGAMSGTTARHNKIAANILVKLQPVAVRSNCEAYVNDMKVRAADDVFYYPDLVITCDQVRDADLTLLTPCLIVEITSPSSERADRREKLTAYLAMPSVKSYIVIDQEVCLVQHHWRDESGGWKRDDLTGDKTITLQCLPTTLSLNEIYDRVEFPTQKERLRIREEAPTYG